MGFLKSVKKVFKGAGSVVTSAVGTVVDNPALAVGAIASVYGAPAWLVGSIVAGGALSSGILDSPDIPSVETYEPFDATVPTYEEQGEPLAKSIRDAEAKRLRSLRGATGTILTSPLGTSGNTKTSGILG